MARTHPLGGGGPHVAAPELEAEDQDKCRVTPSSLVKSTASVPKLAVPNFGLAYSFVRTGGVRAGAAHCATQVVLVLVAMGHVCAIRGPL